MNRILDPKKARSNLKGYDDLTGELVKLEPGQAITGKLISFVEVDGDNGKYPIFTLADDDGAFKVPGTVQIADALQSVSPGDDVYIERTADTKSAKGRKVQTFVIKVKRNSPARSPSDKVASAT